jgi:cerevisin
MRVLWLLVVMFGADAHSHAHSVPKSYVVMFTKDSTAAERLQHHDFVGRMRYYQHQHSQFVGWDYQVTRNYSFGSFAGYAMTVNGGNSSAFVAGVAAMPEVTVVEDDIELFLKRNNSKTQSSCTSQQQVPSWGLARVGVKTPAEVSKGVYTYNTDKAAPVGSDVDMYIMDTGVLVEHEQFEGRASFGVNVGGKIDTDEEGHGTFVAGVAASKDYGVCKQCKVISVKVFTDDWPYPASSESILIAGFEWVAKNFKKDRKTVVNVSVGGNPGQTSDAMDAAVNALVDLGIHVVGAAGNENWNACNISPGRASKIIAVGSMMLLAGTDFFLGGSNWGPCVRILAPGNAIVSLGISSPSAVGRVDTGSSFAAPHVAGVLAELASMHKDASLADVQSMLFNEALDGVVAGTDKGTVNKLVHHDCSSVPTPPTPNTPTPAPSPPGPTPPPTPAPPVPTPPPTPAPPAPTPVQGCAAVTDRFPCGGRTILTEAQCKAASGNCCWSQDPITAIWCFDPPSEAKQAF